MPELGSILCHPRKFQTGRIYNIFLSGRKNIQHEKFRNSALAKKTVGSKFQYFTISMQLICKAQPLIYRPAYFLTAQTERLGPCGEQAKRLFLLY
jgi:hypothetical protein